MQLMLATMAAFVEKDFRVGNIVTNGGVGDPAKTKRVHIAEPDRLLTVDPGG